jgi:argininosuccinate lyase
LVRFCESNGLDLHEPTDAQYASVSPNLTPAVRSVLTVRGSVESRNGVGGTAPSAVTAQQKQITKRVRELARTLKVEGA